MRIIDELLSGQNCLIFTNEAGGGHIAAANQMKREIEQKNQGKLEAEKVHIVTHEILTGTLGNFFGRTISNTWNNNQKRENIRLLNNSLKFYRLANAGAAIPVFFNTLRLVWKNKIDCVITVQPMAIKSIVRAVRVINFVNHHFFNKNTLINVSIILTELPTERTTDFFKSIQELSKSDQKRVKLITTTPLTHAEETEQQFWEKNTGLSMENIIYDNLPIRKAFTELNVENIHQLDNLQVKVKGTEQRQFIDACTENKFNPLAGTELLKLNIQEEDKVFFLMLGSQASFDATLDYVKNSMEAAKESLDAVAAPHYLFVFCGSHEEGQETSLLRATYEAVMKAKEEENCPPNFVIVPLASQEDAQIAPILARSVMTDSRAGGLTAMEVFQVAQGKICIHVVDKESQAQIDEQGNISNEEELLKEGMLFWEGGNYLYLKEKKGAQLTTPAAWRKNLVNIFKDASAASENHLLV